MSGKEHSVEIVGEGPTGTQVALMDKDGVKIVDEDHLLVNSKIVDYRRTITLLLAGTTVAGNIFVADDRYIIESIKEVHSTVSDGSGDINIGVAKGTVTPANSTAQHTTTFNLDATINTVQTATLTTQTTMDVGDRICVKNVGTMTNVVGVMSIVLKRVK